MPGGGSSGAGAAPAARPTRRWACSPRCLSTVNSTMRLVSCAWGPEKPRYPCFRQAACTLTLSLGLEASTLVLTHTKTSSKACAA